MSEQSPPESRPYEPPHVTDLGSLEQITGGGGMGNMEATGSPPKT